MLYPSVFAAFRAEDAGVPDLGVIGNTFWTKLRVGGSQAGCGSGIDPTLAIRKENDVDVDKRISAPG